MSAAVLVVLACDRDGCTRTLALAVRTAAEARSLARQQGWRVGIADPSRQPANNPRLDYCKDHA